MPNLVYIENPHFDRKESVQKTFKNMVLSRPEYHVLEIDNSDAILIRLDIRLICERVESATSKLFAIEELEADQYFWEFEELLLLKAQEHIEKFVDNQKFYRIGFERQDDKWKVWCYITGDYDHHRTCNEFGELTNLNPFKLIDLVVDEIQNENAKFMAECAEIEAKYGDDSGGEE